MDPDDLEEIEGEDQTADPGMCIMLLGVPGVGKTYLLNEASQEVDYNNFKILSMGSVMLKIALEENLVNDRDDMRNLDRESQIALQAMACDYIQAEYIEKGQNVILDTHASILTPKGYLSALSVWTASAIDINYIILLEASPEVILERRSKDNSRRRNADLEEIQEHQDINRGIVTAFTTFSKTILKLIKNEGPGALDEFDQILTS